MTLFRNWLIFALPSTTANIQRCQRIGVAVFKPGLSPAERLAIWNGSIPLTAEDEDLAASFLTKYSADGGATATHLVGIGQLTDGQLLALAERLGDVAALNVKYAVIDANTDILTPRYNVNAFAPYEGQVVTPGQLLAVAGLTQPKPSGGGLSIKTQ